jgi:hypothetical protein
MIADHLRPQRTEHNPPGWSEYAIERRIPLGSGHCPRVRQLCASGKSPTIPETPPSRTSLVTVVDPPSTSPTDQTAGSPRTTRPSRARTQNPSNPLDLIEPIIRSDVQFRSFRINDDNLVPGEANRLSVEFVSHEVVRPLAPMAHERAADISTNCGGRTANLTIGHAKRTEPGHLEKARECRAHWQARRSGQFLTAGARLTEFRQRVSEDLAYRAEHGFPVEPMELMTARDPTDHTTSGEDHKLRGTTAIASRYKVELDSASIVPWENGNLRR